MVARRRGPSPSRKSRAARGRRGRRARPTCGAACRRSRASRRVASSVSRITAASRPRLAQRRAAHLARVVAQRLGSRTRSSAGSCRRTSRSARCARSSVLGDAAGRVHDRVDAAAEVVVGQPDHRADERTAGCASSAASTSAGYTFAPPTRIMSRLAVDEVEVAVLVELAHVAERSPSRRRVAVGLGADVAVGRARPAARQHEDLADLAGRALAAVGAQDPDLALRRSASRRSPGARATRVPEISVPAMRSVPP